MVTSAGYELAAVAGAMACGVSLAFLYDLFRIKRKFVRTSTVFIHIEDILFWLIAAIIVFLASYIISGGETRLYFFLGILSGGLLYFILLSRIVTWALTGLVRAVLWPIGKILGLLAPVVRALLVKAGKLLEKIRDRAAIGVYRVGVDIRRFRNAMTKK
ncbi:MAG: hypothetical protein GX027_09155 [Clostridiaceae bacterium]|jgi:spore cortex biosynthesis protein YabQ|nr:hypothetical protein [Clostridiaceae bacterium]